MPAPATDELKREIARLRKLGMTVEQISESLDCSISTASKYQDHDAGEGLPASKFTESGDEARHEFASRVRIRTVEDAMKHGEVDTKVWYVDRFECTAWEMGHIRKDGVADSLPLWRVKLYLKRILPKPLLSAADAIYDRLATIAPRKFPEPVAGRAGRPVMMSLRTCDVHFGKLAWKPEAGEDNDLKIAEQGYRTALNRITDYTRQFGIEKLVIEVGNDYCHFDNNAGQTTAGTQMDCDGRLAKVIEVAFGAMVWTIEDWLTRADSIEVLHIPGNHDHLTSYFLSRELKSYFRNCPRVKIDADPIVRKYVHWGANLIGYTHGDGLRSPQSLPIVMATERPKEWAESTCREWQLAHLHTSKKFVTKDVDEQCGVVMRWGSSLSGGDAWHHKMGFIGNRRAAEAYIYDRELGNLGHFVGKVT